MASLLERADELAAARPAEAASLYRQAALEEGSDAEALKVKETAVTKLAELLVRSLKLSFLSYVVHALLLHALSIESACRRSKGMHPRSKLCSRSSGQCSQLSPRRRLRSSFAP